MCEKIKNRNLIIRLRLNRRNIFNDKTPFQRGALFIVNRRLRKSTGALSTLFNVRKTRMLHKDTRHPHAGATRVRMENSQREASIFTLRPLVYCRRTRRAHRVHRVARIPSSTVYYRESARSVTPGLTLRSGGRSHRALCIFPVRRVIYSPQINSINLFYSGLLSQK